jgi:undecaprenyl diphosphate synthase
MASPPFHVAIIPDGNRRWTKKRGISVSKGYDTGIRKIGQVLKWCKARGVRMVSMWGFSTDNAKRDSAEIKTLFSLFKKYLGEVIAEERGASPGKKKKYDVRVRFFGRRSLFPADVREAMSRIESLSERNSGYSLNLMLGYGGRGEIVDAVNSIIKSGKREISEEDFSGALYTSGLPDPDLIIRTSGEMRTSGFLPWQAAYSELFFVRKLWPDFTQKDFNAVLDEYSKRMRRFGK